MDKKVRIKVYDYEIDVSIHDGPHFLKTSHYSYGKIYMTCPINTSISKIIDYVKRCYPISLLAKFDKEFLISNDYCYVLGEKKELLRPNMYKEINKNTWIIKDDVDLESKLKKLSIDILTSRVRKYEEIMNTKKHEVKITNMYAARGKNYTKKGLLTFSKELIHFSIELIDTIVIHELAHDFEANHSSSFYEIVYKFCPNYDIKIKKLTYGVKK